ncbi:MAG TPA: hypothetical protein VMY17_00445 [Thermoplasmata archaeon]|nr:hypothetical protein [Thermoplasmata archaeon]
MTTTRTGQGHDELSAYMDILSHDILNNNQAILSCIEFITTSPALDERSREYTAKAAVKVNISTLMFESIRELCLANQSETPPLRPMDLSELLVDAVQALSRLFPRVTVTTSEGLDKTAPSIMGNQMASDLVLMALVNLALLDKSEDGRIDIGIGESGPEHVDVLLSSRHIRIPSAFLEHDAPHLTSDSRSKMVRVAGFLLARLMTKALDGAFEVRGGTDGHPDEGCTIRISLRREGLQ